MKRKTQKEDIPGQVMKRLQGKEMPRIIEGQKIINIFSDKFGKFHVSIEGEQGNQVDILIEATVLIAMAAEFRFRTNKKVKKTYLEIEEYPPLDGVDYRNK